MDVLGAVLLTTGFSLLILGLLEGGVAWDWASPTSLAVFAGAAVALALMVLVERRAAEPVLPLWVFSRRVLLGGNLASVSVGVVLIGLVSYVPTYVQGVLGTGALVAGFALAAMTLGWPIAAALSGRVYLRIGFRDTALIGAAIVVARLGAGGHADRRLGGAHRRGHDVRRRGGAGAVLGADDRRRPVGRRLAAPRAW